MYERHSEDLFRPYPTITNLEKQQTYSSDHRPYLKPVLKKAPIFEPPYLLVTNLEKHQTYSQDR